jgi:hypothetical protein
MAKRRSVILGMGALIFGSGAMSVNAAFNNSVDPGGDFRAIAAEDLVIEPGISFRDGSSANDPYDSSLDGSTGNFYSESHNAFFDTSSPSTGGDDALGTDLSLGDLPAISVSDNTNGAVSVKIATINSDTATTFSQALQVRNDGDTDKEVGAKFVTFGADTDGPTNNNGGDVAEVDVVDSYSFLDSNGNRISTDETQYSGIGSPADASEQRVDNTVTVASGTVEQIDIEVDFTSAVVSDIASASNAGGNPFTGSQDTVQLVETIRFGNNPDSTT